jgi:hypothetical protein
MFLMIPAEEFPYMSLVIIIQSINMRKTPQNHLDIAIISLLTSIAGVQIGGGLLGIISALGRV